MKYILVLAIFIQSFLFSPAGADRKPFLAVFCNPGASDDWDNEPVDLLITGSTWNDYETFIALTKNLSRGRDVIVDIECHGSPDDGRLYLDYMSYGYQYQKQASMGFVLNRINESLPRTREVLIESCYSELCMEQSLKVKDEFRTNGSIEESYKSKTIPYPVWGIGNSVNFNNLIYLQRKNSVKPYFMDLRDTLIDGKAAKRDDSKESKLRSLWALLSTYGTSDPIK